MSALKSRSNSLAGLTLDAVLGGEIVIQPSSPPSPPPLPPQKSLVQVIPHRTTTTTTTTQTLFDIIREEYTKEGHKDRTTWQIFREKLRLKRTGSAWTSSLQIPASDILPLGSAFRPHSGGLSNDPINLRDLVCAIPMSDPPGSSGRSMFSRGSSMRVGSGKNPDDFADVNIPGDGPPSRSFKPQLSRHDSVRDHSDGEEDNRRRHPVVTFVEERQMSAREAVAAQEAAEAEAAANGSSDEEEDDEEDDDSGDTEEKRSSGSSAPKQTMSLMDLLEETDRQMGLTGSRYAMNEEEEYEEEEEGEEEEAEEEEGDGHGEGELSCCVCNVKIKGASFTPCGHTFCKLCSKELSAQKGHCPVCSSFVLEFLEIF